MDANYAAAIFGGLIKVYDDTMDNPVIAQHSTPPFMEMVKVLIIASFTYASLHHMNLPIFIFITHYIHYLIADQESLATHFYYAGMIIAFVLSIITWDTSQLSVLLLVMIILFILGGYIDHRFFPEEYSWKKIIWRAMWSVELIVSMQFSIFEPCYSILFFCVGYFIVSVLTMTYAQCSQTPIEHIKELIKDTHTE